MNVVPPLVDTLLALKLPADVAAPGAVPGTAAVTNDVRLPSRAALQQLLGADFGATRESAPAQQAARFGEATTLSVAARAISAILGAAPDDAVGIRGTSPVWTASSAPVPAQLAGALARVVAGSGLFYESHLQQFAARTRPLALLAQEPQARLGPLASTRPELLTPAPGDMDAWLNPGTKTAAATVISALAGTVSGVDGAAAPVTAKGSEPAPAPGSPQPARAGMPEQQAHLDGPRSGPAGRVDAAYGVQRAADVGFAAGGRVLPEGLEEAPEQGSRPQATVSSPVRSSEHGSAIIHPEAVSLVRQQLEVLAMPVFRWGGEAWPGTPMEWEVHEDHPEASAEADVDSAQRSWSTRLAITLPSLKEVEVRLSLVSDTLQVHLAAKDATTVALLGKGRKELPQCLDDAGLQLTGLQIGVLPATPASQALRKAPDAG
ncbi:hook-length control protein FliK [Polaromonas sp. OV174]|uniref:flagellar hook-length control protein FliK n=1 Tax=Polaromonas sp. OV174 TaxID=1855300 RepID=UPI0008EA3805|nr:flagellar hook-length control protein FliK [Polaromonas sp. OV174]SFC69979.1 hook-length control protein FliK [Polaromonas sp. OV174]